MDSNLHHKTLKKKELYLLSNSIVQPHSLTRPKGWVFFLYVLFPFKCY